MKNIFIIIVFISSLYGCKNQQKNAAELNVDSPVKVTIQNTNGKFQLLVNNEPFYVKGGGLEYGNMKALKDHGGNAIRTWRFDNGQQSGMEVLDEAKSNGLLVVMGLEVEKERHGFDYNDEAAVEKQKQRLLNEVRQMK